MHSRHSPVAFIVRKSQLKIAALRNDVVKRSLTIHVRGSESEDEFKVDAPKRPLGSAVEAIDYGHECAVLWIEAQDHRRY